MGLHSPPSALGNGLSWGIRCPARKPGASCASLRLPTRNNKIILCSANVLLKKVVIWHKIIALFSSCQANAQGSEGAKALMQSIPGGGSLGYFWTEIARELK